MPRKSHAAISGSTGPLNEYVRHASRAVVLEAAHRAHPERFVAGPPIPPPLPTAAWINKPKSADGTVIARA